LVKPKKATGRPQSYAFFGFASVPYGVGMKKKHAWYRPRYYLHFDPSVGFRRAQKIVTSPKKVAEHSFYPLIAYHVTSKKLKHESKTKQLIIKTKIRPIAYAAHLDSHIYSYYAWKLSAIYEDALNIKGISECVLAFRSLGKSNVDFAASAFDEIRKRGNCSVVALDISGFFDNLDHGILKRSWASLLNEKRLPADHFAVYKSLTKFSTVDKGRLYQTLGISPNNPKNGRVRVCEPEKFRELVRNSGLVEKNKNNYGIPQGSPISALLSNIYMINFDIAMHDAVKDVGGKYFRYCDDMLFILPKLSKNKIAGIARENIKKLLIDINTDKTEIRDFIKKAGVIRSDKPLQYLGFTYDGQNILLRSASLARYSEKMKRGVSLAKSTMRKRNKLKISRGEMPKKLFRREIYKRYSHLGSRNFVRYGMRSAEIMNSVAIKRQLKPLWNRLITEIEK